MRLHVFLAKAGIASRRTSEKLIAAGRVQVNGATVTELGTQVAENDRVTFDGREVSPLEQQVYLAVHKPVSVLCTQFDERGRPKVIDLLPEDLRPGLFHVGRLDFMSSGLIFYTNDGDFANIVTHPSSEIEKEYLLESEDPMPAAMLSAYRRGITLDGEILRLKSCRLEGKNKARLVLCQGKNREIRRVCDEFGVKVRRLSRVRIGIVTLDGLSPGRFRRLTEGEKAWFFGNRRPASPKMHAGS